MATSSVRVVNATEPHAYTGSRCGYTRVFFAKCFPSLHHVPGTVGGTWPCSNKASRVPQSLCRGVNEKTNKRVAEQEEGAHQSGNSPSKLFQGPPGENRTALVTARLVKGCFLLRVTERPPGGSEAGSEVWEMTCKQPVTHSVQRLSHASERTDLAQATKGAGSVGLRPEREGVRGDYGPLRHGFIPRGDF